jgi:DNA-binding winged helix-turn-helix (wHTH) protein
MRKLSFSEFEIDLETTTLTRLGEKVPIGKRTCDALLFLIQNKERYISRNELHRHIWASTRIAASTIPMCISEIRKALTDDPASPRFISSQRRRGYRFIAQASLFTTGESTGEAGHEFPFAGRQAIISALQMAIQSTLTDLRGRTITIIGEAGSGKTRLVNEFAQRTASRTELITARAISSDSESPYSIWSSALRAAIWRYPENKQLTKAANQIANILPEIPHTTERAIPSAPHDQNSFLIEWSEAFKSIVSQRPLILILEDIHHADIDSLKLLERVSAEITSSPIVIIATMRPLPTNRQQASITARILGDTDSSLIPLPPLRLPDIESFIDEFLPGRREIAHQILTQTSGNAFYATYLARLVKNGGIPSPLETTSPPIEIDATEIVSKQLGDLPHSCRHALAAASVSGFTFSPTTLARALKVDTDEIIQQLAPAECAQVLTFDGSQYAFRHSILRDLLYYAIDPNFRMELHLSIAESLAPGTATSISAFDHLHRAYPLAPIYKVCDAGRAAAAEASSRFAHNEARRFLTTTLKLASKDPGMQDKDRCDIMIALARATLYSGDRNESRSLLLTAATLARSIKLPDRLARCGLDLAPDFLSIEVGTYDFELISILRESLRLLPHRETSLRSQVIARLSQAIGWGGEERDSTESLANEALRLANSCNDPIAMTSALAALADASTGPDLTDQRIDRIKRLQIATQSLADHFSFLVQQTRLIAALLEKGEFRQVRLENERYREVAERTGLPQYCWYPVSTDSMLACASGDFDLADEHARRYAEIAGPKADRNFQQTYACQYILREIERDRSEQVLPIVEEYARSNRSVLSWAAATAWIQWDCGRFNSARETLRQFSHSDILKLYREPGGTIGLAALSETAAYLGDRNTVSFLYKLIAPVSFRFATAGYGVAYFGSLARYASLLAISLRMADRAVRHAASAVHEEERLGTPSWRFLAELDLSRAQAMSPNGRPPKDRAPSPPEGLNLPRIDRVFRSPR